MDERSCKESLQVAGEMQGELQGGGVQGGELEKQLEKKFSQMVFGYAEKRRGKELENWKLCLRRRGRLRMRWKETVGDSLQEI